MLFYGVWCACARGRGREGGSNKWGVERGRDKDQGSGMEGRNVVTWEGLFVADTYISPCPCARNTEDNPSNHKHTHLADALMAVANGLVTRYFCPRPFLLFPKLPSVSSSVAHGGGICMLMLGGAPGGTELERLTGEPFVFPARRVWERYTVSREGQHLSHS